MAAWYAEAAAVVRVPEAVAVATSTADGRPSVRMVLMKAWDEAGVVFYTNYDSRKARELEANPRAALLFHWDPLGRQVRIEGTVSRVSAEESELYFASRPFGARIGAWASHQSEPVGSRDELDERVRSLVARRFRRQSRAARVVGRLPARTGGVRVLAEQGRQVARPASLLALGCGRLAAGAAPAVAERQRVLRRFSATLAMSDPRTTSAAGVG